MDNLKTYIAGFGINSVLGNSNKEIFENLLKGKICYRIHEERIDLGYHSPLFAKIENKQYLKTNERLPIEFQNIAAVVQNCIDDSFPINYKNKRCGIIVSTDSNITNIKNMFEQYNIYNSSKGISINHSFDTLNSCISLLLAKVFDINSLNLTVSSACSGGGHAIGLAKLYLEADLLDYCFVIGYQEDNDYAQLGFDNTRLFSKTCCRPFDKNRDGLIPSSGCGCLLLTNIEKYNKYGEIFGYGISTGNDKIYPDKKSLFKCIQRACYNLSDLSKIIYINAHATGTQIGDAEELFVLSSLLKSKFEKCLDDKKQLIVSTKALTGHECWAAGINEIIYSLIQAYNGVFFKQYNYESTEDELFEHKKFIMTENKYIKSTEDKYILSNSFGFGGSNSSILIKLK